jgi:hypothetical protein
VLDDFLQDFQTVSGEPRHLLLFRCSCHF